MNDSFTTLSTHLDSGYPGIFFRTHEEERALRLLESYCQSRTENVQGPEFYTYSVEAGLVCRFTPSQSNKSKVICKPNQVASHLADLPGDCVVALLDFHPYFRDPVITRGVKELIQAFRQAEHDRSLVFLSWDLEIPKELDKDIVILDFDLPPADLALGIAQGVVDQYNAQVEDKAALPKEAHLAALGLTENEIAQVFTKVLVEHSAIKVSAIHAEKKQIIKRSGVLEYIDTSLSFNSIGGLKNLKGWLEKRRKAFTPRAKEQGIPAPKGMLAVGMPGCGKSLMAKACAGAWEFPLIRLDMGSLMQGVVGGSEASMRSALRTIEAVAPCVLWVDEIEKAFSGTASSGKSDGGTLSRMFGLFLTWMQEKSCDVFVVATANDVSSLPPELLRKGRFDEIFFVDLPSPDERKEILSIHLKNINRQPGHFDLVSLSAMSDQFSGAELEQAVKEALLEAFSAGTGVNTDLVKQALTATTPLARSAKDKLDLIRQWAKNNHIPRAS